ncbi:MAG: hypothetical protein AB1592_02030 [Pseudomonadota bacterium]
MTSTFQDPGSSPAAAGLTGPEEGASPAPGAEEVRAALARILASDEFASSPRLADFLRFIVDVTLAGRAEAIKGYTIAVEALGRPTSFDPQSDPIVRVEATRLRRALDRYYASAGGEDPLEISVPKGSYIPAFRRRIEEREPALPDPTPVPRALETPRRAVRGWMIGVVLALAAVVIFASAGLQVAWERGSSFLTVTVGGHPTTAADLADRIGLPVLEVERFEAAGAPAPPGEEIHTLEVRLRGALARFDFLDVTASGSGVARECTGVPPRPVFTLGGLAEGRPDGGYALLVRLSDRCAGTIVWSKELEGISPSESRAAGEARIVQDIAGSLVESNGALQARARAQARLEAPQSGFGCLARVLPLPGGPGGDDTTARECLARFAERDSGYGLFHSAKAALMLEEAREIRLGGMLPAGGEAWRADLQREARLGVDLAPASAFASRILAEADFVAGDREGALLAAERAVALNPLDYDVAAACGAVMVGLGQVNQGEALLRLARKNGARLSESQTVYLAIAAFLRNDSAAALKALSGLEGHTDPAATLAQALAFSALGRPDEERRAVSTLMRTVGGSFEKIQVMVQRLLRSEEEALRVLGELESAGLRAQPALHTPSKG